MAPEFDMKKVTTPLLLHMLGKELRFKKTWETIGTPKLLIIARYRMGFELTNKGDASQVRVFVDYSLPINAPGSWLGHLLGAL